MRVCLSPLPTVSLARMPKCHRTLNHSGLLCSQHTGVTRPQGSCVAPETALIRPVSQRQSSRAGWHPCVMQCPTQSYLLHSPPLQWRWSPQHLTWMPMGCDSGWLWGRATDACAVSCGDGGIVVGKGGNQLGLMQHVACPCPCQAEALTL